MRKFMYLSVILISFIGTLCVSFAPNNIIENPKAYGKHIYLERVYQEKWCKACNGQAEVMLPDKARVDCVTDKFAVEVDFAVKWAESLTQALYYALMLDKEPGILIIVEDYEKDKIFLDRLDRTIKYWKLPVTVWTITPEGME